ncbi:MAG: hypothetical protein II175_00100 [Schwartzia sp.]|nr:hypothetical protein [Schwartzia sp. (in: firmicutes)]MBQ2047679.1 hypothetical protein [Schwartzia sp. (in: firmicutes)]MDY6296372.1 hypothetical protein [Schwartzia succinivorans]
MRRIFSAFLFLWIMLLSIPFGEAAEQSTAAPAPAPLENREKPLRIALVPVVDRTGGWISRGEMDEILERMEQEIHVPLNETMHWVEHLPYSDVEYAFKDGLKSGRKKSIYADAIRSVSETVPADLVICAVVETHYQREFLSMNWDSSFMVESIASLSLYVYDKKSDKVKDYHASRWERDEYSLSIDVQALTMDALEEVLRDADIRSYIFPISKEQKKILEKAAERNE